MIDEKHTPSLSILNNIYIFINHNKYTKGVTFGNNLICIINYKYLKGVCFKDTLYTVFFYNKTYNI